MNVNFLENKFSKKLVTFKCISDIEIAEKEGERRFLDLRKKTSKIIIYMKDSFELCIALCIALSFTVT